MRSCPKAIAMTAVRDARRLGSATAMLALALALFGCAVAPAPLPNPPHIVATPERGILTVTVNPAPSVGDVQPVYVSIANGTDIPRRIVPGQIFALDDGGARTAPIPPREAARQAGGAEELKAALESGAVSGVAEGAVGAGVGAIVGSALGGAGNAARGALVGTAIGGGQGVFRGVMAGPAKARREANQQIGALALHRGEVRRDFTVSGYVFFPKGEYRQIEFLLVNAETGDTEVIKRPWR